jgi:hypothetical protein
LRIIRSSLTEDAPNVSLVIVSSPHDLGDAVDVLRVGRHAFQINGWSSAESLTVHMRPLELLSLFEGLEESHELRFAVQVEPGGDFALGLAIRRVPT